MADIAILVAEEYERRIKNSRKAAAEGGGETVITLVSAPVSEMALRMKNKIRQQISEEVNWVLEPKSQIGVAASNGFFSA